MYTNQITLNACSYKIVEQIIQNNIVKNNSKITQRVVDDSRARDNTIYVQYKAIW